VSGPRVSLVGRVFGRWTVLRRAPRRGADPKWKWLCRCACGRTGAVRTTQLLNGKSQSCGGCAFPAQVRPRRPRAQIDLRGQTIGQLLVLRPLAKNLPSRSFPAGHTAWLCRCACGREVIVKTASLRHRSRAAVPSCGCLKLLPLAPPRATTPVSRPITSGETHDDVQEPPDQTPPALMPAPAREAPLTPQEREAGWHLSQLGKTRRICVPVDEDDEVGGVLFDGDPFT